MDQTLLAFVFIGILVLVLLYNRKQVEIQKVLFPIIYFVLVRTTLGIRLMDRIAHVGRWVLKPLSTLAIGAAFVGMALIVFELFRVLVKSIFSPTAVSGVGVVQPFVQDVPGTVFVPFLYFILSIPIIAIIHEFSHGVVARLYDIKLKSSGFAFVTLIVPIIPAAFVEPDEKALFKRPLKQQLAVFAAGPVSNLLTAALVMLVYFFLLAPIVGGMVLFDGVSVVRVTEGLPAQLAGIMPGEVVKSIDDITLKSMEHFSEVLAVKKPGDTLTLQTNKAAYHLNLVAHPEDPARSYLGIDGRRSYRPDGPFVETYGTFAAEAFLWFVGLLFWIYLLSMGIGLFNLVPLGPIDGGRMFKAVLDRLFPHQSGKMFSTVSTILLIVIVVDILLNFLLHLIL